MIQKDFYLYSNLSTRSAGGNTRIHVGHQEVLRRFSIAIFCFLVGRVIIFKEVAPFGIAFFASVMTVTSYNVIPMMGLVIAVLTYGVGAFALKYVISAVLLFFYGRILLLRKIELTRFRAAIGTFTALMISGMIFSYTRGMLAYDLILTGFESLIGFVMVYVFSYANGVIMEHRRRRILSSEEMICISIFLVLVIMGIGDIKIWGLSIRNIMLILLTLLLSYIAGAGAGACAGITAGLVVSLTAQPDPFLIANLGICGLMAGTFKELGKVGTSCAFIMANALMTFYINKSTSVIIPLGEIACGIAILVFIPSRVVDFLKQYFDSTFAKQKERNYYVRRMYEIARGRLDEFCRVLRQLARLFYRISDQKVVAGQEEISKLFDLVAEQVCASCALHRRCWERDFYQTYRDMFKLLMIAESKSTVKREDVPEYMIKKCLKIERVIEVMNNIYGMYKTDLEWRNKIEECRQLVAGQLDGISNVVAQLAAELDIDVRFKNDLEDEIRLELDKNGIRVHDVFVIQKADEKIEVSISKKACGRKMECIRLIEDIVSGVIGKRMIKKTRECTCSDGGRCILELVQARKFQVITGIARRARTFKGISGDSYSFTPVKNGKYMLAISDGMGSGKRAAEESTAVISLLENFLEAGFDLNITINTINSILMIRSKEEIFATVDLCLIDLVTGGVQFVKIGAVATFIKHHDGVEIIKASTLPIGILEDVDLQTVSYQVQEDDMIIMVTDGVLDSLAQIEDPDGWLADVIGNMDTKNPQEMADCIIKEVLKQTGEKSRDDMTVMVSRVWKPV